MLRKVLSRFFEVGNQFPTSETILSIYSEPSCEKALINVSHSEEKGFYVAFNDTLMCEMGGKANLVHLAYLEEFAIDGDWKSVIVEDKDLIANILQDLLRASFMRKPRIECFRITVGGESVDLHDIATKAAFPKVLGLSLGFTSLIALLLVIFLCGGTDTFKERHASFSPVQDPVMQLVKSLYTDFSSEFDWSFDGTFDDCCVTMTYDDKKDLVTSVLVIENQSGLTVYERNLQETEDRRYVANVKFYGTSENLLVSLEAILTRYDWIGKRKDVNYSNCLEAHELKYESGDLQFMTGGRVSKSFDYDGEMVVTDYWSNGQKRLVKRYSYNENAKRKWKIQSASNYKADGSAGNPIEIFALLRGRWIGFSSNLIRTASREPIYMILKPNSGDWSRGSVLVCSSTSSCKNDYRFIEKGYYSIDEDDYIKLYSMKDSRGNKCDTKRLKVGGTSPNQIALSGTYDNISSRFVSNVNLASHSWFKKSVRTKYKFN